MVSCDHIRVQEWSGGAFHGDRKTAVGECTRVVPGRSLLFHVLAARFRVAGKDLPSDLSRDPLAIPSPPLWYSFFQLKVLDC